MAALNKKEQAMSEKNRKRFTRRHKTKIAFEAIRDVKTVNEIAHEFGVHPTQVAPS
jgi:transposase-like protein